MFDILQDLITVIELLSFLVSLMLYFRRNIPIYLKFFPYFLFITVAVELTARVLRSQHAKFHMFAIYNYFFVFEFLFYFFFLYHVIHNRRVKKIILCTGVLYAIFAVATNLLQGVRKFQTVTYCVGAVLLVCFCVYYFYDLFKARIPKYPVREPAFLISLGLLIYYSCSLPMWAAWNWVHNNKFEVNTYKLILSTTNFILYSLFAVAFFCFFKFTEQPTNKPELN